MSAEGLGVGFAQTDENGQYTIELMPGQYRVRFSHNGLEQWADRKLSFFDADLFTVVANETTVLDQQLLGRGTITGVLRAADGTPVPFADVTATLLSDRGVQAFASTDEQGRYWLEVHAGEYGLTFRTSRGEQYATGRSSAIDADPVTVVADMVTTHDETLLPPGPLTITGVNSVTGTPLSEFCVSLVGQNPCTQDGALELDLLAGRYSLFFFIEDKAYVATTLVVDVASGVPQSLVVPFDPAATVTAQMVDKATGAPVFSACLELVEVNTPNSLDGFEVRCSDETGMVRLDMVRAGTYKAFAWSQDSVHGHQWVANNHGVGQFEKATSFVIAAGQDVTLPPIRLDKAGGVVTGTVTDEATGEPVMFGTLSLSSFGLNEDGPGRGSYPIIDGKYTASGLGPYQWTFLLQASGYAAEWSGDKPTRSTAKTVHVHPNKNVVHDIAVGPGTTVTGTVTDARGVVAYNAFVSFVAVDSRDPIATGALFPGSDHPGQYVAQVNGQQQVRVRYDAQIGVGHYSGWVGGTAFDDATTFTISGDGTLTLNITALDVAPF